jgi:hypothetical protein
LTSANALIEIGIGDCIVDDALIEKQISRSTKELYFKRNDDHLLLV